MQWILSTQATIDLVIGYTPPSAPYPNDPSGTSVTGVGGKLTPPDGPSHPQEIVPQRESAKHAKRVSREMLPL